MLSLLWSPLFFLSCQSSKETIPDPVYIDAGVPEVGAAEAFLDFPIGSPMGGYTARCGYLGGAGKPDNRKSAYILAFNPSAGIQTTPTVKVLWIDNGDQSFVLIKVDVIYSYDQLIEDVEDQLEAATGLELDGRVMITASHTHNAPANFSDQIPFYLGGDRYNEESFRRFVKTISETALQAYDTREEASIGVSIHKDWDPQDDVYVDRRPENNDLELWPDQVDGKDPYLWILRADTLSGNPIAVFFNFGIHGTALGDDNTLISTDATGAIENVLQSRFDPSVVVAHFQGPAGDISPVAKSERGHPFARLEALGEYAVDTIYDAWDVTPTASTPIEIESVGRSIPQSQTEVRVTRNGTVDWYYNPYERGYEPDNIIFDDDGNVLSPLDEFNTEYGAVFCGYDEPLISTGTIGATVPPYDGCMQIELISYVINGVFQLDGFVEGGEAPLPLPSSLRAGVGASRIGPMRIRTADGQELDDDLLMGFFPGEASSLFADQYRRRAKSELGFEHVMTIAYAQDHEGYLLVPEDWFLGGYESNINLWGPLQGEYLMESTLTMIDEHLTTTQLEPQDPDGLWHPTSYPQRELPMLAPDETPTAGIAVTEMPEYVYNYFDMDLELSPPSIVRRGQDIVQFMWEGGDPGVDSPKIILERFREDAWEEVTLDSGHVVDETRPDIVLTLTPSPLYPLSALQSNFYSLFWQAVPSLGDRMGLPEGVYRFHIYGKTYAGGAQTWPWPTEEYELTSPEFSVVPGDLSVSLDENQLTVSFDGPEKGFRLLSLDGASNGANPPVDPTVTLLHSDGTETILDIEPVLVQGSLSYSIEDVDDVISISVADLYGNTGIWESD
ncbi:MAG: neutral/alkaline non-lysosomal ceramidase N-terminal domain-containing protein [Myxococcota bacterium]|nr:neutral/alkaline non-lysosomal ceramidase N-terminal domain-containing protein [Myxococcota bacterium]